MNEIIKKIVDEKIPCYFISPHQDDAVYSAGGLMAYLSDKTKTTLINVFDGGGDAPYTLSAKIFVKNCGYKSVSTLVKKRHTEDKTAADLYNINLVDLGYDDALWRKKFSRYKFINKLGVILPEMLHIYPLYRTHIKNGKISKYDRVLIKNIKSKLTHIIDKNSFVFCPSSLGGHVDHKIVKKVCTDLFENLIYWSDYPYSINLKNYSALKYVKYSSTFAFTSRQKERLAMAKKYESQNSTVFCGESIRFISEQYFIKENNKEDNSELIYKTIDEVDGNIAKIWNELWENSCNATFFNSYDWFNICKNTFEEQKIKVLLVYKGSNLFALLPLTSVNIKLLKNEIYLCPGEKHLDKFSLLIKEYEFKSVRSIIDYITDKYPAFVMSEVDAQVISILNSKENIKTVASSVTPLIPEIDNKLEYLRHKYSHSMENIINANSRDLKFLEIENNKYKYFDDVLKIEKLSVRKEEGKGTFESETDRKLFIEIFKNLEKYLYLVFLSFKGKLSAYRIGIGYKSTYYDLNTAYLSEVAHIYPGKLLLYHILKDRMHESMKSVDMLRGDAKIKRDFTPFFENRYNVFVSKNPVLLNYLYLNDTFKYFIYENKHMYNLYLLFKNIFKH